jgi:hypothetical protein
MKQTTIFMTYNPKVGSEQTLAVRLHTIGAVNGFRMYMPDRHNSDSILDTETQRRINMSDYLVLFSLGKLSAIVKQEIEYAFKHLQDKSKIIVIYDSRKGKNLKGDITQHFTPFYFNPTEGNVDAFLNSVVTTIFHKEHITHQNQQHKAENARLQSEKQTEQGLTALLGIGVGLFVLNALAKQIGF